MAGGTLSILFFFPSSRLHWFAFSLLDASPEAVARSSFHQGAVPIITQHVMPARNCAIVECGFSRVAPACGAGYRRTEVQMRSPLVIRDNNAIEASLKKEHSSSSAAVFGLCIDPSKPTLC